MKERPILFSGPMVLAILCRSKTQTRRTAKFPSWVSEVNLGGGFYFHGEGRHPSGECENEKCSHSAGLCTSGSDAMFTLQCPYGSAGGRLRVKEAAWMWCERKPNGTTPKGRQKWHYVPLQGSPVMYAANHPNRPKTDAVSPSTENKWGWRFKVARFLPKWASRITLEIVSIRVERLQDISEADALAEGIFFDEPMGGFVSDAEGRSFHGASAKRAYENLWYGINGADSWGENPWVWVIEFRSIEQ